MQDLATPTSTTTDAMALKFFADTIQWLYSKYFEGCSNQIKIDRIVSNHWVAIIRIDLKLLFWFLVTPTGKTTDAIDMKIFSRHYPFITHNYMVLKDIHVGIKLTRW